MDYTRGTGPKKSILVIALLFIMITSAGCWNRREIENIGFVLAVGVDHAGQEGKVKLTVHLAKPFAIAGPAGPIEERPFWLVSSTGYTVFEAVRNFLSQSPRRLFWAHNEFLLLGEEFARSGIKEVIDWFARDGETRRRVMIVVARGATAEELLTAEFEQERIPARGGRGIIMTSEEYLSTVATININKFLQILEKEGVEPVAVRAELMPKTREGNIKGDLKREKIAFSPRVAGWAVFKDDRLRGWLDKKETRGLLWVQGKVKMGIIVVPHPRSAGKLVSLEITGCRSEVKPVVNGGRPKVHVTVQSDMIFGETQEYLDPLKEPFIWDNLEKQAALVIKNEIRSAVKAAKDLNSDVFGFGSVIYQSHPRIWQEQYRNWEEKFAELEVKIDVKVKIKRAGLVLRSFNVR